MDFCISQSHRGFILFEVFLLSKRSSMCQVDMKIARKISNLEDFKTKGEMKQKQMR